MNLRVNNRELCCVASTQNYRSISTVERARCEWSWVVTTPKYCQLIREASKLKLLEWFQQMINTMSSLRMWCSLMRAVQLETHRKHCYRKKCTPRKLKPCPKHPLKVHIWGGGNVKTWPNCQCHIHWNNDCYTLHLDPGSWSVTFCKLTLSIWV